MDQKKIITGLVAFVAIVGILACLWGIYASINIRNTQKNAGIELVNGDKNQTSDSSTDADTGTNNRADEPKKMTDMQLSDAVFKALLKHYNVVEFPDILYTDPENDLGYLDSITPTNPGANDGEVTLAFSNQYATTSQYASKQIAISVMQIVGTNLPELNGVTASFGSGIEHAFFAERADRSVLGDSNGATQ